MSPQITDADVLERNETLETMYRQASLSDEPEDLDRAHEMELMLADRLADGLCAQCPCTDDFDPKIKALGDDYLGRTAEGTLVVLGVDRYNPSGRGHWRELNLMEYDEL